MNSGSWQAGQEPNDFVKIILNRYEIKTHHRARQITVDDFSTFDYMFGMDLFNINELNKYAASLNSSTQVKLLGDFNPSGEKVIADPYFDNRLEDFEKSFEQINASCAELLKHLLCSTKQNCT